MVGGTGCQGQWYLSVGAGAARLAGLAQAAGARAQVGTGAGTGVGAGPELLPLGALCGGDKGAAAALVPLAPTPAPGSAHWPPAIPVEQLWALQTRCRSSGRRGQGSPWAPGTGTGSRRRSAVPPPQLALQELHRDQGPSRQPAAGSDVPGRPLIPTPTSHHSPSSTHHLPPAAHHVLPTSHHPPSSTHQPILPSTIQHHHHHHLHHHHNQHHH